MGPHLQNYMQKHRKCPANTAFRKIGNILWDILGLKPRLTYFNGFDRRVY